jgi:hypothetical protein
MGIRTETLTGFQRAVILVDAVLVALRLFAPVRYIPNENAISYVPGVWVGSIYPDLSGMWFGSHEYLTRILVSATVFQALGIAILATVICLLLPRPPLWLGKTAQIVLFAALAVGLFMLVFYVLGVLFSERGSKTQAPRATSSRTADEFSLDEVAKARDLWNGIQNCSIRMEKVSAEDRDLLVRYLASTHTKVRRLPDPIASAFCDHGR